MSLEGHLQDLPLIDMLYIFDASHKNGKIFFTHHNKRAILWLDHGRLIHAVLIELTSKKISCQGCSVIESILSWPNASFKFSENHELHTIEPTIQGSLEQIFMKSYNNKKTPTVDIDPRCNVKLNTRLESNAPTITLSLEHWKVIRCLITEMTVDSLSKQLDYSIEHTETILQEMVVLNLVAIRKPIAVAPRQIKLANSLSTIQRQKYIRNIVESIKQRLRRKAQGATYVHG